MNVANKAVGMSEADKAKDQKELGTIKMQHCELPPVRRRKECPAPRGRFRRLFQPGLIMEVLTRAIYIGNDL